MRRLIAGIALAAANATAAWKQLRPLPDREGFAGSFAAITNGILLVAGGANFPTARPWEGGSKVWYATVFALDRPDGEWRVAGKLPRANGYGVAVSTPRGALFIGGGDARENFRDALLLRLAKNRLVIDRLPDLPMPLAMSAGAVVGDHVYVAGGLARPDAVAAERVFLRLDLRKHDARWESLAPWPGKERFFATAAALDDAFHLFGGARLVPAGDGKTQREWLTDCYRYDVSEGKWTRIADLPRPIVAAPTPAPRVRGRLLLLGGDDGSLLKVAPQQHPGFPRTSLAYDPARDAWQEAGELPFSLVTTSLAEWHGGFVIPGGEARPGVRSPEVWHGVR